MCRNFIYEVVGQRRKLKAIKKNVVQKLTLYTPAVNKLLMPVKDSWTSSPKAVSSIESKIKAVFIVAPAKYTNLKNK
jgi:hypothetical protein